MEDGVRRQEHAPSIGRILHSRGVDRGFVCVPVFRDLCVEIVYFAALRIRLLDSTQFVTVALPRPAKLLSTSLC